MWIAPGNPLHSPAVRSPSPEELTRERCERDTEFVRGLQARLDREEWEEPESSPAPVSRPATCHVCGAPTKALGGTPMFADHYVCPAGPAHYFEWRLRSRVASPEQVAAAKQRVAECEAMYLCLMDTCREVCIGGRWLKLTVFC